MNPLRFTRRNLLRGGLAATAAYPLLEADKVKGQTASPTRLIVFTTPNGVIVIGYKNYPARLATSASQLFSRNLVSFLEIMFDKNTKAFAVPWDDELVKATVLTKDGAIVHPNIKLAA